MAALNGTLQGGGRGRGGGGSGCGSEGAARIIVGTAEAAIAVDLDGVAAVVDGRTLHGPAIRFTVLNMATLHRYFYVR